MNVYRQLDFNLAEPWKMVDGYKTAEFFAGIGLVRQAIEAEGFRVVFANDIEPKKKRIYDANFQGGDFVLGDVRALSGDDIPDIELATASFPCTDLSLAGNRAGLEGRESGLFWEFARVIEEMRGRRPAALLLENVLGFATSNKGVDLRAAVERLNDLGYTCDVFMANASWFVPQSRPRLFIVAAKSGIGSPSLAASALRPSALVELLEQPPVLRLSARTLNRPVRAATTLADVVEKLDERDLCWWEPKRTEAFVASLSSLQAARLEDLRQSERLCWASAYRRTRGGKPVWEIRADFISGCLRTAKGGSSKQALVEAGQGKFRIRWMTPREYARLQGVPDDFRLDVVTPGQALFGLGDAVCVPVIRWIAKSYLKPLLTESLEPGGKAAGAGYG